MEEQGAPGQLHRPGGHQCCQLKLPPVHQGEGISRLNVLMSASQTLAGLPI